MIDLTHDREAMLADIGASDAAFENRLDDAHDPAFLELDQASVVVSRAWEEILPRLRVPLARRFADLPPEQFIRDIERPLKMGLGNAFKRGNGHDRRKRISVEAVVTERGTVIAISNEGNGFDFEATLRRFRAEENYFTNKGGGFKAFERAGSVVSYADGGRTLLIRFQRGPDSAAPELSLSDDFMASVLRRLGIIRKRGYALESCHAEALERHAPGRPELRYVLGIRVAPTEVRDVALTGRLLSESGARREHSVARQLYKRSFKDAEDLRVPRPLEAFDRHPRLVLYRFDPGGDLRDGVESDDGLTSVAAGLRALHRSEISVDFDETPHRARGRRRRTQRSVVAGLSRTCPDRVPRAQRFFDSLEPSAARVGELSARVPIHGSFGAECIRRAEDRRGTERLYVYRFDECRLSHPGFDVGGLFADLERWASDPAARKELFLASYLTGDSAPWLDALPFFTARAHLDRLDARLRQPEGAAPEEIDEALERCERALAEPTLT